jgi:hypothetical protein
MANITLKDLDQPRELDDVDMANVAGGADTIYRIHGTNEPWSSETETMDLGARSYNTRTGTCLSYSGRR